MSVVTLVILTVFSRSFQTWKILVAFVVIVVPLSACAQQAVTIPRDTAAQTQVYDVTTYGAIPNDGKNDTVPIRNAINDAIMRVVVPSISLEAFTMCTNCNWRAIRNWAREELTSPYVM